MKNKAIIAVLLVAAIAVSGLALMGVTGRTYATMSEEEIESIGLKSPEPVGSGDRYLLTAEQMEAMKEKAQEMRDAHATRTEIREAVQTMLHGYVQDNLESYGLAEEDIEPIQAKISELMDKMLEIRERAHELWGQDMNRQDIKAELQPLIEEAKTLKRELKEMLDSHDILPPDIQHPGADGRQGRGPGRGRFGRRRPRP